MLLLVTGIGLRICVMLIVSMVMLTHMHPHVDHIQLDPIPTQALSRRRPASQNIVRAVKGRPEP